jgi:hypothetical protein
MLHFPLLLLINSFSASYNLTKEAKNEVEQWFLIEKPWQPNKTGKYFTKKWIKDMKKRAL